MKNYVLKCVHKNGEGSELYRQRWRIEVFFRDLKTTLGMEMLRSKTSDMVEKEIRVFFIANNVIRLLIFDSEASCDNQEKSFKSSVQLLLAYSENSIDQKYLYSKRLLKDLLHNISGCDLLKRPNRVEPRVVKRRPKPFKLMMKPRSELRIELHRNTA